MKHSPYRPHECLYFTCTILLCVSSAAKRTPYQEIWGCSEMWYTGWSMDGTMSNGGRRYVRRLSQGRENDMERETPTPETYEVLLRDVMSSDLPIFFEQQLDSDANHMAAFTAKDPTDRDAFM